MDNETLLEEINRLQDVVDYYVGKAFRCVECNVDTSSVTGIGEYYMVRNDVWPLKGPGMLCIGCVEQRIGRTLTPQDFTNVPVNHGSFSHSSRLRNRLGLDTVSST